MKRVLVLSLCLMGLSACAEVELASHVAKKAMPSSQSSPATQGTFKVGSAYKVKGQWYEPKETYSFTQTGVASWYGPNFNGKKTANGEIFNMNELTAAHKTLQLPSLVRVTNLDNGRSVVVRVNDRGPFSNGRIIDLSKRAAQELDFIRQGTARVKIQVLSEESRQIAELAKGGQSTRGTELALNNRASAHPAPLQQSRVAAAATPAPKPALALQIPPGTTHGIYVQAGSFSNPQNAENLVNRLRSFGTAKIHSALIDGREFYRVRFGPMQNEQKAGTLMARLNDTGQSAAVVVVD
ncbi:MAG: septal ring lytic transglycosylase RlpA family protein [Alphaproteobacteria bacterium]|nr:septal ring lytic transglycosylase RlpA family protein [Alphaproteobacteria bacterium]